MNEFSKVLETISEVVIGCRNSATLMLTTLIAKGHILIEDIPGVGKTLLAHSLAKSTDLSFSRVQCTPDLLPGDILGYTIIDMTNANPRYVEGPIMNNLVLVDEINRASAKTQSALLEVMEETQVTLDGKTHCVPSPFMVIATQNPIEYMGTSPLPEAQLDRFMMRISLGYLSKDEEIQMLDRFMQKNPIDQISAVLSKQNLLELQKAANNINVSPQVKKYIVDIIHQTRQHPQVSLGASTRASLSLMRAAQALALINSKDYVSPDEIKLLAVPVLAHRIILKKNVGGVNSAELSQAVINEVLQNIKVPI